MNTPKKGLIAGRWDALKKDRGDLIDRCETYARWTLPYLCPQEEDTNDRAQEQDLVSVGPRGVNHLANMVVTSLFPHDRPFFTLMPSIEAEDELREAKGEDADGALMAIKEAAGVVEQRGMRQLNLVKYRPAAILASKHLIVTGNAIIRRDENDKRIVYGVKDHVIRRDMSGEVSECVLRDCKFVSTLPEELAEEVKKMYVDKNDDDTVKLYTRIRNKGEWQIITQAVDDIDLERVVRIKRADSPFLFLTWNLTKGDNYGRGLVEDNSALFHLVEVNTMTLLTALAVVADIKFLVDPVSELDIVALNKSASGTYHAGRDGDISTVKLDRVLELQQVRENLMEYERRLAMIFLLTSSSVRDAERVTAQEVRLIANELETSFGGIYSQFAADWQHPEAQYILKNMDFDMSDFDAQVVTGIESLSRSGQMDNLRIWLDDLSALQNVPEEFRASIDPDRYAAFTAANRQVPYREFLKTQDQKQEEAEQQQRAVQQAQNSQGMTDLAVEAGKQAVKEG